MFIYKITNTKNGKAYIGQTTQQPTVRWSQHRRSLNGNYHRNAFLQRAWNKDGESSFTFSIIGEYKTIVELNAAEILLIGNNVGGYNLDLGGRNGKHSERTKRLMRSIKHKPWTEEQKRNKSAGAVRKYEYPFVLVSPTGETVSVTHLKNFCRQYDLDHSAITRVASGKTPSHKGWTRIGTDKKSKSERLVHHKRPQGYPPMISPDGKIIEIDNLNQFARTHNLNVSSVHAVITGKRNHTKGWMLL